MKYIDLEAQGDLLDKKLEDGEVFLFRCHEGLECFTRCCRNLNLFLYPYDVLRLKNRLNISSEQFLDSYVDIVLRESNFFPDVLLRMAENKEKTCPFLNESGCTVYSDRPDTCRTFPLEQGILFQSTAGKATDVYFFKPPYFCLGQYEPQEWTSESWAQDQGARFRFSKHFLKAVQGEVRSVKKDQNRRGGVDEVWFCMGQVLCLGNQRPLLKAPLFELAGLAQLEQWSDG